MKWFFTTVLGSALLICFATLNPAFSKQKISSKSTLATNVEPSTSQLASTLDNLQKAYSDEVNAQARYVAFAKKADDEGYHQVASMFRAIAHAEEVHAGNFATLITAKGGVPHATLETPDVKTTHENLQMAVAGEDYEKDIQYPQFIQQARKDKDKDAERSFNYSRVAESEHCAIYDQALNDLDSYKGGNQNFFVCPHCGKTTVAMRNPKCPLCSTPRDQFVKIN